MRHADITLHGVRPGEAKPFGIRTWEDEKGPCGWIASNICGRGSRWFNVQVWGSWRFVFHLARLQRAIWEAGKGSEALPREPGTPLVASSCDGPLTSFFVRTSFARSILARLEGEGFAVLHGVLQPEEANAALARMWDFVETVSPTVHRNDEATWYPQEGGACSEPWPHTSRDMFQDYQAGWVFGHLRELLATRLFERLYGTKELHCSKDGFCFQRPTRRPLSRRPIDHFDQSGTKRGLHCVQASVSLLDQGVDDGCFSCWPGSHRHHPALAGGCGSRDWYRLSDEDKATLTAAGCMLKRVPVGRGDVVLWRSDLAHYGSSPVAIRQGFRAVVYICMLPASLTPEALYPKKRQAYEQLQTGSHWPTKEEWFRKTARWKTGFDKSLARPFFTMPPELTPRLEELCGLRCYGTPS